MYNNIFIIADGAITLDVTGFLENIRDDVKRCIVWNCGGAASLIVFMKCVGYDYSEMMYKLGRLKCLEALIFGGSIEPGGDKIILEELKKWMTEILEDSRIFDENSSLKDVYSSFKLFPNFIAYNNGFVNLNPITTPNYTLFDSVLASLVNYGTFDSYTIFSTEYTSFSIHDVFPREHGVYFGKKKNVCYIANYSICEESGNVFVNKCQNSLKNVYFRRVMEKIKDYPDVVLINGFNKNKNIDSHKENGKIHKEMIEKGESTLFKMEEMIEERNSSKQK
jgi:hypothetical protein